MAAAPKKTMKKSVGSTTSAASNNAPTTIQLHQAMGTPPRYLTMGEPVLPGREDRRGCGSKQGRRSARILP